MYNMKPLERRNKVKEMREHNMTFKEIGEQMNVSASRARDLYQSATKYDRWENELYRLRLLNNSKSYKIRTHVSDRALNALYRNKIDDAEKLLSLSEEDVRNLRSVGEKLFHEIMFLKEEIQNG